MSGLQLKCALVAMIAVSLIGCGSSGRETVAKPATTQVTLLTEFERMLGLVPYDFLEEHDIWFGNPGMAKQLHGVEGVDSLADWFGHDDEQFYIVGKALAGIAWRTDIMSSRLDKWNDTFGFGGMMVNRIVFSDVSPPWCFSFMEGGFDTNLIVSRLSEHGYEERQYGAFTYYTISDDFALNLENRATRIAMASMNRVAILDGTIVTAPATDIMTSILDAMEGKNFSIADDVACRAIATSMGEVLSAVIMIPDRLLHFAPGHGEMPPCDFTIPEDWGLMHPYDMVGMGYEDDGEQGSWVISLYYTDGDAAKSDAMELAKRMDSYVFTGAGPVENVPLTDLFKVGIPTVEPYLDGATLTVRCSLYPKTDPYIWLWIGRMNRDLLFLAPEPSLYTR